ncbi:MAG: PKD domain-containing protein [Candidatus Hodarchaeales archaeon]|jgi:PKD repeat protein
MKSKKVVAIWLVIALVTTVVGAVSGAVILNPAIITGTITVTGEIVTNGRADAYSIPSGFDGHDYNAPNGLYEVKIEEDNDYWVTSAARMYDNLPSDYYTDSYLTMGRQVTYVGIDETVEMDFSMIPGYICPVVTVTGGEIQRMYFSAFSSYYPTEQHTYNAQHSIYAKSGYSLSGTTSFPMKPDLAVRVNGYVVINNIQYNLPTQYDIVVTEGDTNCAYVYWDLNLQPGSISGSFVVEGEDENNYYYYIRGEADIDGNSVSFDDRNGLDSQDYYVDVPPATWSIYPDIIFNDPSTLGSSRLILPPVEVSVPSNEDVTHDWYIEPGYVTGNIDLYGAYGNLNWDIVYASKPGQGGSASDMAYSEDYRLILDEGDWAVGWPTYQRFTYDDHAGHSLLTVYNHSIPNSGLTHVSPGTTVPNVDFSYGTAIITVNFLVEGGGILWSPYLSASSSEGTHPNRIVSYASSMGSNVPTTLGESTITVLAGSHIVSAYAYVEGGSYTRFGVFSIDVEPGDVVQQDIDAPTVDVTQPSGFEHTCDSSIIVAGTATDVSGVATITVNGEEVAFTSTGNPDDPNNVSFSTTAEGLEIGENMITIVVKDTADNSYTVDRTVIRDDCNLPPEITLITGPLDPAVAVGTPYEMTGTFTDQDVGDMHTAIWDWGDGHTSPGTVYQNNDIVTGSHNYEIPGVYTVTLTVTDAAGESDTETWSQYSVIYDPSAGFVTGGGWIDSPEGAYTADPSLSGKANFGFVSKYKKGVTVPTGNTEFQFHAGDLNFHSDSYEWLVIAGANAKFKGTGTINGEGSYKFMVTAVDGELSGSGALDKFRIKIWIEDEVTGEEIIIYDNGPEGTEIGGGSIKIHEG